MGELFMISHLQLTFHAVTRVCENFLKVSVSPLSRFGFRSSHRHIDGYYQKEMFTKRKLIDYLSFELIKLESMQ